MIITENMGDRVRHYSDEGLYILQVETNKLYEDAVDVIPSHYTYEETDVVIPEEDPTTEEKAAAYDILMGGGSYE